MASSTWSYLKNSQLECIDVLNGSHLACAPPGGVKVRIVFLLALLVNAHLWASDNENYSDNESEIPSAYTPKERRCFFEIYKPSLNIIQRIAQRSDNAFPSDNGDLEEGLFADLSVVKKLAEQLKNDHIEHIGIGLKEFINYLNTEENFYKNYNKHVDNVKDTVQIGGASALVGAIVVAVSSLAQIGQEGCIKYDCLDDDFDLLTTDQVNGKPYNYCGLNGTDYDCLRFLHYALGYNDLTNVHYVANCSKNLDPTMINMTIPLGQITRFRDITCTALLASLPYIPGLAFLLPGIFLTAKTAISTVALKIAKYHLEKHQKAPDDLDALIFADGKNIVMGISLQIGNIINFAGLFFELSEGGNGLIEELFEGDVIHNEVEIMIKQCSWCTTLRKGLRKAFCCPS